MAWLALRAMRLALLRRDGEHAALRRYKGPKANKWEGSIPSSRFNSGQRRQPRQLGGRMTINRRLAVRNEWKCDQCGKVGIWDKGWWAGGSIALEECCPEDVPTLCSDECKDKFDERIKKGEVEVPTVKLRGYTAKVIGKRRGY